MGNFLKGSKMRAATHNAKGQWMRGLAAFALAGALMAGQLWAQETPAVQNQMPQQDDTAKAAAGNGQGVVLDRVVAVVNGDLILESDLDEERRFEEIQPYREVRGNASRSRTIERLIDRTLIRQQAALEPETAVSDTELDAQLARLKKDIPECKQYDCETEEGWKNFLGDHGFTVEEFRERWLQRMVLLRFIEVRFRNGITIPDSEIKGYYEKTMLPEYARRHVTPPPLDTISKRIQEVLLQQQVSALLVDWLKSLRVQGSVKIMVPGEVAP